MAAVLKSLPGDGQTFLSWSPKLYELNVHGHWSVFAAHPIPWSTSYIVYFQSVLAATCDSSSVSLLIESPASANCLKNLKLKVL